MPNVFVAGLFHETHTFLEHSTGIDEFDTRVGGELLSCCGDSSPLGGALEAFESWGWSVTPGPDFRALPSGTVDDDVIEAFWEAFVAAWDPTVDAIFLVLHGAMVSTSHLDVEAEVLARIRRLPGADAIPIFGVYDLHANFSDAMASHANALVAYRCNPHSDARDASLIAANLLRRCFDSGRAPWISHRSAQLIWAPTATGSADDPMRTLLALARDMEQRHSFVWAANVTAGFAFADTPDTGVSFQIVTTDRAATDGLLDQLVAAARRLDAAVAVEDQDVGQVFAQITNQSVPGLTVLIEPSDNIGGGAPGDTTGLLRALVDSRLSDAAICINDPATVASLHGQRPGTRTRVAIGGKGSRFDKGPLDLEVELVSSSNGQFELLDKQSHLASIAGDRFEMGDCVVVRHGGLLILLTSRKTPPFDLGQWASQGIDVARLRVIAVKAAVAHRQAYDPITARSFTVDTRGPCRSDLSQFRYRHATFRCSC